MLNGQEARRTTGQPDEGEDMTWDREWRPHGGRPRRRWPVVVGVLVAVVVVAAGVGAGLQLTRTVRQPTVQLESLPRTVPAPSGGPIPWPTQGEAAMSIPGVVDFPAVGGDTPVPIASVTKLMTVMVLLQDHPLTPGEDGPDIPVTTADVLDYMAEAAAQDSVVPLAVGEQLSEYQAIEAMLVPSADDVADLVATWDAGSIPAFVAQMNALAVKWGLTGTHFADASGLDPQSVSTATDVMELGERAMSSPVVSSVVGLPRVTLPNMTKPATNTDFVLGEDGIIGVKTGSDSAAGGCFVFAAVVQVDGATKMAYGAVLGQHTGTSILDTVLQKGLDLVEALHRVARGIVLVRAHQQVAALQPGWQAAVALRAGAKVALVAATGASVTTRLVVRHVPTNRAVPAGTVVGQLRVSAGSGHLTVPVVTARRLGTPSVFWRLLHG